MTNYYITINDIRSNQTYLRCPVPIHCSGSGSGGGGGSVKMSPDKILPPPPRQ